MQQLDIPIVQKTYDFYQALEDLHKAVPRSMRYTLWQRCQNNALELLQNLIRVRYFPEEERRRHLVEASVLVDTLRILIRLSFDSKGISQEKYILLQGKLDEIGRMLGGWMKSVKEKAPPPLS